MGNSALHTEVHIYVANIQGGGGVWGTIPVKNLRYQKVDQSSAF